MEMNMLFSTFMKYPNHILFLINEVPSFYGDQNHTDLDTRVENFNKVLDCANWCLKFGVREVSFCMFSGIVFKFPREEIEKTFLCFRIALIKWLKREILFSKHIRFQVIDECSLLPNDVLKIVDVVQNATKFNDGIILNIIIGHAGESKLNYLATTFQCHNIESKQNALTKDSEEPLLIISNCSYKRLTDYLIWKTSSRSILHVHIPWNKFTLWHFIFCILRFQFRS